MILEDYTQKSYTIDEPYIIQDPYGISPLTALVLFETESPAKVSIKIVGKDEYSSVEHTFSDYNTSHQIPIAGLYAEYANSIIVILEYTDNVKEVHEIEIKTNALVQDGSIVEIMLNYTNPALMQEGMTFIIPITKDLIALDCYSEIRWQLNMPAYQIMKRLSTGNLIITGENVLEFYEIDLLGKIYNIYYNDSWIHHDIYEMPNGNFIVTSNCTGSLEDEIVELDRSTGEVIWETDLREALDQNRFNVQGDLDWLHMNSLWFDENDSSIIVSGRHQGVFKVSYPEGELIWMTTMPFELESISEKYLTPTGENFKAPSGQHAVMILDDQDNNPDTLDVMLFDNNHTVLEMEEYDDNCQYSRMVQYRINEDQMTIEEIWSFGEELGSNYFAEAVCDADLLENNNVLGTFGTRPNIGDESAFITNLASVIEVTQDKEIVFDVDIYFDNFSYLYRSERLNMYPDTWDFKLLSSLNSKKPINYIDVTDSPIFIETHRLEADNFLLNSFDAKIDETMNTLYVDFWQKMYGSSADNHTTSLVFQSDEVTKIVEIDPFDYSIVEANGIVEKIKLWLRDVDRSKIDAYIDLDDIKANLPAGTYKLGILVETPWNQQYGESEYYFTVEDNEPLKVDYLTLQKELENNLNQMISSEEFTIENPFVLVNPYETAPLSALVHFETAKSGTVSIEVLGDYPISHKFDESTTIHTIPIYGLYANTLNYVKIAFTDTSGNVTENIIEIQTEDLPPNFQDMEITVSGDWNDELTFLSSRYLAAYDQNGDVRWYLDDEFISATVSMIEWLENGNIAVFNPYMIRPLYYVTGFFEVDMMGRVHNEFLVSGVHHDLVELENGDFLVASEADRHTTEDYIIRIDRTTGTVIETYDFTEILVDMGLFADETYANRTILDRAAIMKGASDEAILDAAIAVSTEDWLHNNAIYFDEDNNKMILSARQKDAIIQIDATSKEVDWILTDSTATWAENYADKLLSPIGEDFEYSYGQHAVYMIEGGDIILYDNGNFRSKDPETALSASDNYSRGVRYKVDVVNMTVEQVFEYGKERGNELYTPFIGDIDYLGEDHYIINFGGLIIGENEERLDSAIELFADPENVRGESIIVEVINDEVVSEFKIFGGFYPNSYRVERNNLYKNTTSYVDLNLTANRLGEGFETEYISDIALEKSIFSNTSKVLTIIDQGSRFGFEVFHSFEKGYLVIKNDDDIRGYEITSEEMIYIDKAGLHDGVYEVMVSNQEGEYIELGYYLRVGNGEIFELSTKLLDMPIIVLLITSIPAFFILMFFHKKFKRKKCNQTTF